MSDVVITPFKKPKCGDMHTLGGLNTVSAIKDVLGGLENFAIVGTDPDIDQPVVGTAMTEDYGPIFEESTVNPGYTRVSPDGTFYICIEAEGTFAVVLADGTQFTITAAQASAYLGQWYPAKLLKVLQTGTTGSFSVGY